MAFTYEDFRNEQGLRLEVSSFLGSDIGRLMMRVVRDKFRPIDVPAITDSLASARKLSALGGAHDALDAIEELALPPTPAAQLESNFDAPETDHEKMPSAEELRPKIVISTVPPVPEEGN